RGIERRRLAASREIPCLIVVVLEHEMDRPLAAEAAAHRGRDLAQDVVGAAVLDRMHGVEAQSVEMIFLEPVERVLDEEVAHGPALGAVEIDRRAPWRPMTLGEEV